MKIKLTNSAVEKADEGIHWFERQRGDGALGLRVAESGLRTYFLKRRVTGSGKERNIKLGRHGQGVLLPDGSLRPIPFGAEDARIAAGLKSAQLATGIDPVQRRQDAEAAAVVQAKEDEALSTTLQQVMDHYLEHHRVKDRKLRPKTQKDYRDFMTRHFGPWLPRPVAGITRSMCVERIIQIKSKSSSQGNKATVYLRLFLNYARDLHETDDGEFPLLAVNPAERSRKITKTHPPKPRDRALPLNKVGVAWLTLRRRSEHPRKELDRTAADWVSSVILTGWRLTESGALRWSYIDFEKRTVTLPGDIEPEDLLFAGVKNHHSQTWPMSDALYNILKARSELPTRDDTYVFQSWGDCPYIRNARGTIKIIAKLAGPEFYKIEGKKTKVLLSMHDFRRTFDAIAEASKVGADVKRRLTNHVSGDVHFKHYTGTQAFADAMAAIADYVVSAARVAEAQESGANVIAFPVKAGLG